MVSIERDMLLFHLISPPFSLERDEPIVEFNECYDDTLSS